jgi:hypothetical protein
MTDALVAAGGPTLALPLLFALEPPVATGEVPMVMRVAPDGGAAGVGAPSGTIDCVGDAAAMDTSTEDATEAATREDAADTDSTPSPVEEASGGGGGAI